MKAYVISLKRNSDRRAHVREELTKIPFVDAQIVEGFDGHALSPDKAAECFDCDRLSRREGRIARPGEIGCTMSHQICYRKLVESGSDWALILEDDLIVPESAIISEAIINEAISKAEGPSVILLSGWFWWDKSTALCAGARLAEVYLGHLTHAYLINRRAAERLITDRPYFFADDWHLFRRLGVNIYGIVPHLIDQDWSGTFKTEVNDREKVRSRFSLKRFSSWLYKSLRLKYLSVTNRFEPPQL